MGLFSGKKGLVFGIANDHSIAWAITECLHAEGAEIGFTHLPDKDPTMPRMERRVKKLVEPIGAKFLIALQRAGRCRPRPRLRDGEGAVRHNRLRAAFDRVCSDRRPPGPDRRVQP